MNKYSSKAIKTAATVGMSLAMVLSNVAPVMAADTTVGTETKMCAADIEKVDCGRAVLNAILEKLDGTPFAETNMDDALTVAAKDGSKITIYEAIEENIASLKAYKATLSYSSAEYKAITAMDKFNSAMTDLFGKDYSTADASEENYFGANDSIVKNVLKDGSYTKTLLNDLKDAKKDAGEIIGGDFLTLVNQAQNKLEDELNIPEEDFDKELADFYDAFNKVLENDLDGKKTTLTKEEAILTGYKKDATDDFEVPAIKLSSKTAVKNRINKIKDANDYDQFKDEDLVVSLIEAYEDILENIGNITDITSTDSYKEYNKTKTADEDVTVKNFLYGVAVDDKKVDGKVNTDGKYESTAGLTAEKEAKAVAKVLDNEQWAILKDLKEEVLDSVWNFETSKVGNYYRDKSNFNSFVSGTQKNVVMNNIPGFLLKVVDTETGKFGYELLEERMEAVNDALAAVTTDIAKLTPANIKASDKALLEAAEDALYELQDGKYKNNLTSKEKRTVRQADTKITNLREAFDNLGTTNAAGWYSMGNGDWGYNNEDGTPAAYKWVASGADWYMIKDGKMLRNTWLATDGGRWYYLDNAGKMVTNQSVDGCWINSYGVYMSPTYNG